MRLWVAMAVEHLRGYHTCSGVTGDAVHNSVYGLAFLFRFRFPSAGFGSTLGHPDPKTGVPPWPCGKSP